MNTDQTITQGIAHFLDRVAEHLTAKTPTQKRESLADLESHIHEALASRAHSRPATLEDLQAILTEMDPPETYAQTLTPEYEQQKPNTKLVVLSLLCSGLQIAGLVTTVVGVPVVGAVTGFAAIVNFFIIWSNEQSPKWLVRLTGVAAICGLVAIIVEIARAL